MRLHGIIRLLVLLGFSLGIFVTAGCMNFANAQSSDGKGLELIARALKSYEAGAYTDASTSIDEAFKAGLSNELAARAILLRGQVNEKSGKLARALQDYSNALWMETLPSAERKKATEGKERVIAAMGLTSGSTPSARSADAPGGGPSLPAAADQSSSGGVFGMFNGLFGSSSPAKPEPIATNEPPKGWQTSTPATAAVVEAPAKKVGASAPIRPAAATKVASVAKPAATPVPAVKKAALQQASAASVATNADGFLIVFGSANSQAAGRSRAQQIKAQLSDILVNRDLTVEAGSSGGFEIVAGPYKAKSAALALCSAMKQRGVACQVTP
jgi:hypothetical protein